MSTKAKSRTKNEFYVQGRLKWIWKKPFFRWIAGFFIKMEVSLIPIPESMRITSWIKDGQKKVRSNTWIRIYATKFEGLFLHEIKN